MTNRLLIDSPAALPIGTPHFDLLDATSPVGERLLHCREIVPAYGSYCIEELLRSRSTPEGTIAMRKVVYGDQLLLSGVVSSGPWRHDVNGPVVYDIEFTAIVAHLMPGEHVETTTDALLAEYRRLTLESV